MRHTRLMGWIGAVIVVVGAVPTPLPADGAAYADPYRGPLVDNEATRSALHRLAVREDQYTQTLAVTTHVVVTRVAGDEEWRAHFGSTNWDNAAEDRIEAADNQMYTNWGIQFVVTEFVPWNSNPDAGASCSTLLEDLRADIGRGSTDVLAGFTLQNTGVGGCALNWRFLIDFQSATQDWKVTQHEISHLYGADHGSGIHPDDVMEDPYNHPNKWCTYLSGPGWDHWGDIAVNADKFD